MHNKIREIRKQKGLTLHQVAARIQPRPTTAQTIGRLETGSRKVTLDWLEKIAVALQCPMAELMPMDGDRPVPFAGTLSSGGEIIPADGETLSFHPPGDAAIALKIAQPTADFQVGDTVICLPVPVAEATRLVGKECLTELDGGRRIYGRLLAGTEPGRYTVVGLGDTAAVAYNAVLRSLARRAMLIRRY